MPLDSLLKLLWLAVIFITLSGVAMGRLPGLAMNRATICLVGATVLVLTGAISRASAYQAIDMDTIVLLLAMMVINVHLRHAGFFQWAARWTLSQSMAPPGILAGLMLVSGLLSALFLNDTVVLALTPLVVAVARGAGLPPVPFLMGLAVSANIGSVATIIGNPQNMLIGIASGISYQRFLAVLAPVALGGVVIAWCVLALLYRQAWQSPARPVKTDPVAAPPSAPCTTMPPRQNLLRKSLVATMLLLFSLLAGVPVALAALGAAALLLITRHMPPEQVFREMDWGLLVFFASLFVVTGAVESIGLSGWLLHALGVEHHLDIPSLTITGAILSNLVSNVPAVLLLRPVVVQAPAPEMAWLTLAMATTFAGNLTLLGSVANLIVAESARTQGVLLSFRAYLVAGVPITLLTLIWGDIWLIFL
ncbi:MAG: anion transporter [Magnetococcales bacterium]|nr:anion transporter [Magnetococcales bacterium]